jgi:hypothetical protein
MIEAASASTRDLLGFIGEGSGSAVHERPADKPKASGS